MNDYSEHSNRQSPTSREVLEDSADELGPVLARFLYGIAGPFSEAQLDSLILTPSRWARALIDMTAGYEEDPKEILQRSFEQEFDQMIVVPDIDFTSLCEHHLLPFTGRAVVGYIPSNGRVVGLSKIPRLVDCFARRLQLQERMTKQIADALEEELDPLAVGVILQAQHQCMTCRGVKKLNASMVTSDLRGEFRHDSQARSEFLSFR